MPDLLVMVYTDCFDGIVQLKLSNKIEMGCPNPKVGI